MRHLSYYKEGGGGFNPFFIYVIFCTRAPVPGPDEVPGGAHEEAGLHGRPAELHLAPQPRPPAGEPPVGSLALVPTLRSIA